MIRPLTSLVLVLTLGVASAQEGRNAQAYNLADGLALQGYDPVAYFDVGGAVPTRGQAEIQAEHGGVTYRFASEENKRAFLADPERYEPAHGGWCSYAMSLGQKIEVDPLAFRVSEGRLFLFVDTDYVEVDSDWTEDEHANIGKADANWKKLSGESPRTAASDSWRWVNNWNLTDDDLAIEGYDPVAYFPEGGGEPKQGKARYSQRHEGVLYRFANQKNLDLFRADPERYEPQHGGWCSYAMGATGELVEVDPEAYRLTDDQLHLFYTGWFNDTREDWDDDTAALKRKADSNWDALVAKQTPRS